MNKTSIEWVKNPDGGQGYTWNPITGCLNGCSYCYARKLAEGRLKNRYLANQNIAPLYQDGLYPASERDLRLEAVHNPFYPRFWEDRLPSDMHCDSKLIRAKGPRGIFVCDMSDLFGIGIPENWTKRIMEIIEANPWHRFYLLTKQPQNLIKFSPFPDNCWVGVTATDAAMAQKAEIYLRRIEARIKFISFEPLLGQPILADNFRKTINWVIIGAQTKPYKPPKIEWVQEIHDAADKAGVPIFLKDNLLPLFKTEMGYLNKDWLRQEMPVETDKA